VNGALEPFLSFQIECDMPCALQRRGPDIQGIKKVKVNDYECGYFFGCTLHFRGCPTQQPLLLEDGSALLWNGEIFHGFQV
jgi:ectoine hydroxylase-related dioxygenase (phytanoyl-CoA dioxygenase family)